MAIINTYPSVTPKGADLLIGTQVKDDTVLENSTKSFAVSAIGSFLITSNNIITGSGTLRKIPMFTPNGQAIGDSIMFQKPNDSEIQVGVYGLGSETTLGAGYISTTGLGVKNISATEGGEVTLSGNVVIGDGLGLPDYLTISSSVQDSNAAVGTEGQILVADSSSRLLWTNIADIAGSGTTNTLPVWTDGPNGVLGDSLITQTISPDVVTIGSRFIVSPNSILALEISQGAGKALVTISDNLKVEGTYYDAASDEGTDGDVLLAKGTPGNMVSRWTSLANAGITSGIETAQVTVTDAQIQTLGTVPVEIIPSTANASIQIIGLTTQNKGSGPLGSNYDWSSSGNGVFYGQGFTPTQHQVEIPNSYLPEGSSLAPDIYVASITPGTMKAGSSIRLTTTTGVNPSIPIGESPSAEMIVNVTYRIIPII